MNNVGFNKKPLVCVCNNDVLRLSLSLYLCLSVSVCLSLSFSHSRHWNAVYPSISSALLTTFPLTSRRECASSADDSNCVLYSKWFMYRYRSSCRCVLSRSVLCRSSAKSFHWKSIPPSAERQSFSSSNCWPVWCPDIQSLKSNVNSIHLATLKQAIEETNVHVPQRSLSQRQSRPIKRRCTHTDVMYYRYDGRNSSSNDY